MEPMAESVIEGEDKDEDEGEECGRRSRHSKKKEENKLVEDRWSRLLCDPGGIACDNVGGEGHQRCPLWTHISLIFMQLCWMI